MTRGLWIGLLLLAVGSSACANRKTAQKPKTAHELTRVYWGDRLLPPNASTENGAAEANTSALESTLKEAQEAGRDFRFICYPEQSSAPSDSARAIADQLYSPTHFTTWIDSDATTACTRFPGKEYAKLEALWAEGNTRDALIAALARKEVYFTSGPRMRARMFASWTFKKKHGKSADIAKLGYHYGHPMGSEIKHAPEGKPPRFLVYAFKDPEGANIDVIQIVKRWTNKDGSKYERPYDVARSTRKDAQGNRIGSAWLTGFWEDPDFDSNQVATYMMVVLQLSGSEEGYAFTAPIVYTP